MKNDIVDYLFFVLSILPIFICGYIAGYLSYLLRFKKETNEKETTK